MSVSITMKIGTKKVYLTPTNRPDHWKIRVGRKSSTLPFIHFETMTIIEENIPMASKTRPNILIWTNTGIKITCNGKDNLAITVPSRMKSTLCGLCGDYNGRQADDLLTRRGGRVNSLDKFIESWKIGINGFYPRKLKFTKMT